MIQLRKLLISGFIIAVLTCGVAAQERKLYPVDQAGQDQSFKVFRDRLIAAARKKDKQFILSILDPNIELSFGGDRGIKDFNKMYNLDKPNSPFWTELTKVLSLGGAFKATDGRREFVAPYVTSQWPEDGTVDGFEYVAVTGTNVRLRAAPGLSSPIVASLSYDIVKLVDMRQSASERKDGLKWIKVMTGAGKEGYLADKYVRSPIDYRAFFRKIKGNWLMVAFIAGD